MLCSRPTSWILALVCGALVAAGCSTTTDTPQGDTGSLSMSLAVDGIEIDEVTWVITGNDMEPMGDTIDVSAPGSTASVEVFGLLPGGPYTVTLKATDGETECEGSENFFVEAGEVTTKMVVLRCKLPQRFGSVRVNGEFNICAELDKAVVSPLVTSVGNDIDLSAEASDADGPDLSITYEWDAGVENAIADPSAQKTTYTCKEEGPDLITISVYDDVLCKMVAWTFEVLCVPGDGLGCDSDEQCDEGEICDDNNQCVPVLDCTEDAQCEEDGNPCTAAVCENNECGQAPTNEGGSCNSGSGSGDGSCNDAGECNSNDDCTANDQCQDEDGNECTAPVCDTASTPYVCTEDASAAEGDPCDAGSGEGSGTCNGAGECIPSTVDPPPATKVISVGCTNSITDDVSILEWTLTADPGVIVGGDPVTVDYDGIGAFDETFLDAAQSVVPGGVTKAALNSIAATVVPRTGLTGADADNGVVLGNPDESVAPFTCAQYTVCDADSTEVGEACFSDAQCTGGLCIPAECDPANDVSPPSPACDPVEGPTCGNFDCVFSFGNPSSGDICRQFIEIPTTTTGCDCQAGTGSDCIGSGNECDTDDLFVVGQNKLATQCDPLGYCVTGGLSLPLASATGSYTAAASGDVLIGWEDRFTRLGASVECTDLNPPSADYPDNACDGDAGTWALPAPAVPGTATVPPPGIGLRVNAGGLAVGVDCLMGVTAGNDTVDNDGKLDQSAPTPDTCTQQNVDDGVECTLGEDLLIRFSIQP